jgi:tRNA-specific 2-thiouridylase
MSGGVDSSVAALLLKKQGFDVLGVTMQVWQEESELEQEEKGGCCGLSAVEDARRVSRVIGIPHYVMNFRREFRENVMDYFVREYMAGRTPNPCIVCNRRVKWESLLQKSLALGADYIATGHYASVVKMPGGRYSLHTSPSSKDQTYALYGLTQDQLAHTLMPLGEYTKDEVREMAREAGLPVADKPDSEEICFIPDHDYAKFIEEDTGIRDREGLFVDEEGNVLGIHKGITHYTVGQRKHLGIALGRPIFVKQILPDENKIILADNERLFEKTFRADSLNFMSVPALEGRTRAIVKIRYNHAGSSAIIEPEGSGSVRVTFDEPQRAITPGQAAVFYQDGCILGGGTIE